MSPGRQPGAGAPTHRRVRGSARSFGSRSVRRILVVAGFALVVPATAILVAAPLWYVSTQLRGAYTILVVAWLIALFVRRVARQVRHPHR